MEDNPRMVERSRGRTVQRSPPSCLRTTSMSGQGVASKAWRGDGLSQPRGEGDGEGGNEMTGSMLLIREFCDRFVPAEKATRTRVVCYAWDLGRLNLSGPLAPELGQLDQLQYMEIFGNSISGPIPSEFGSLANLISLDLSSNSISGAIPAALGNAKSLKFLRLDHNRQTGPIPRELAGLPNLGIV
ncbi:hypothetical protein ZEAMMB73_Zm00001d051454 [Zea mays]|uniref:Uncharacterized protein n=1 Tax=Zea mays TaxID=4577 RepID=A0A1D6Q6Z6_MAIZE|nr:hypothetical protein ZEAMMB73_Zm00001d051454 [Zea mays]